MRVSIYPYKKGSKSARVLAEALGVRRLKHEGSRYKPGPRKMILNWGSSSMPDDWAQYPVLNHPNMVGIATNKLTALKAMADEGVSVPTFADDKTRAATWLEGGPVVCRTKLQGSGGEGIVIARTEQELVAAPLYVQYVKKKSEWRVHIFNGEVIMVQRKVRNFDIPDEEVKWEVRNRVNGFVFQQHGINPPVSVIEEASKAMDSLDLDFGAVDVIFNEHLDTAFVLEVNCAPGLEGTTIERYKNAVLSVMKGV